MKKLLTVLWIAACLALILFAGNKLFGISEFYREGSDLYDGIAEDYAVTAPAQPPEQAADSVETAPIAVDFDALLDTCGDVVGWLYCEDTPVNYPVVQGKDNNYYLYRLLDGTQHPNGTLFLDCNAAPDFSGWNSVIYGHNMKNDTMFGSLEEYRKQEYYNAHPVLYLLTPEQDYKVVLIAGYVTPSTSDAYTIPEMVEERDKLAEKAISASTFQTDVEVAEEDRLLSLSTCVYDYENARYVLVGVLRPIGKQDTP